MELQRLKEKLPNISIRYTGTWKDTLRFNIGLATTAGGILLTLLGGGSEVISVGASTAVSVPATAAGVAVTGSGLAISGSALANMFDVRIQKSESSKGSESGKSENEGKTTVDDLVKDLDETTNGKGVARNSESTGGYEQTLEEFVSELITIIHSCLSSVINSDNKMITLAYTGRIIWMDKSNNQKNYKYDNK